MTAPGWEHWFTPGRLPDRPTVRLVGVTSHRVRRGVHEHREYVTTDGMAVTVTHWPAQPSTRSVVTWWTADGERHEFAEPGSVEWALTRAGFEVATPTTPR